MAELVDTDKPDKTPLLKEKKTRPPQSEKQMANFRIMQEKRAKNTEDRKQEKILVAQRALLVKEGYVKATAKLAQDVIKEQIQFDIEDEDEPVQIKTTQRRIVKEKQLPPITTPKVKPSKKVKAREPEPESESEESNGDSDSSEEVIIIKRKSKKIKSKLKRNIEEDEDDVAEPTNQNIDYRNFFC